jgi:hypothetical protein
MPIHLVSRRTVWFPTTSGWLLLLGLLVTPIALWIFRGEAFLAATERLPADVLVVEGWIGVAGINAAHAEYLRGGYRMVVATGGLTGERWNQRRWNYAEEAAEQLLKLGVPREHVLLASSRDVEIQRTFEMATAAHEALKAAGLQAGTLNVFTRGSHARRSRLIFEKVFGRAFKVGVVAWKPPLFDELSWWQSSDRAEDMVKETVGYFFELLFNSGRRSNSVAVVSPYSAAIKQQQNPSMACSRS